MPIKAKDFIVQALLNRFLHLTMTRILWNFPQRDSFSIAMSKGKHMYLSCIDLTIFLSIQTRTPDSAYDRTKLAGLGML